jgi:SHS2 domain-containing protein
MPYEFHPEAATADIAFTASGSTLEQCLSESVEALLAVTVTNPEQVEKKEERSFMVKAPDRDLLLFDLLQECIFHKDTDRLLLHCSGIEVLHRDGNWEARAHLQGERLDPKRHHQRVDVKAVTLHEFSLKEEQGQWKAHMILDI